MNSAVRFVYNYTLKYKKSDLINFYVNVWFENEESLDEHNGWLVP